MHISPTDVQIVMCSDQTNTVFFGLWFFFETKVITPQEVYKLNYRVKGYLLLDLWSFRRSEKLYT